MSESWDDYAEGWDDNESVIQYSENAYNTLSNILDVDGMRVLDFGCGTGLLTEKMSEKAREIVAIDPSKKMLSVLESKKLKNVVLISEELTRELIDKNDRLKPGFDLVVASSALAFVPDFLETLKFLKKLINKRGTLVQWDWLREREGAGGFSKASLESAYDHVGFAEYNTSIAFVMGTPDKGEQVVMGVAKNACVEK